MFDVHNKGFDGYEAWWDLHDGVLTTYRMLFMTYRMLCTKYTMYLVKTYDTFKVTLSICLARRNINTFIDFIHNLHMRSIGRSQRPTLCIQRQLRCIQHQR